MTTDVFEGVHYFCVDVEVSDLRPQDGQLLSIGCVVLDVDGNCVDTFYERCTVVSLSPSWFNESLPPTSDTQEWWRSQNQFVKNEAYADRGLKRFAPSLVGHHFRNFALQYGADSRDRILVASPDAFDVKWVDHLMWLSNVPSPFYYHAFDLWSMRHARHAASRRAPNKGLVDVSRRFDDERATPSCPHHALSDAYAAAVEMSQFLKNELIDLDEPAIAGYDEWLADQEAASSAEEDALHEGSGVESESES